MIIFFQHPHIFNITKAVFPISVHTTKRHAAVSVYLDLEPLGRAEPGVVADAYGECVLLYGIF